ncbi:MAG: hypothetical protein RSH26_02400 [Clostridia bacterium]
MADHMNPYFFFFAAYAVLITPITLRWGLRLGKDAGYSLRIQAAGMPFVRERKEDDRVGELPIREQEVARTLASTNLALLRAALHGKVLRRFLRAIHLESLHIRARLSFADASRTALCFAAARTLLQTLHACGVPMSKLSGHVTANFDFQGSEVLIRGIVAARLGSLGFAAILFGTAFLRAQGRQARPEQKDWKTFS